MQEGWRTPLPEPFIRAFGHHGKALFQGGFEQIDMLGVSLLMQS